jgi:hypothetical protein
LNSSGTDLATKVVEGSPITNLQHLRTEIILSDAGNVAFWFSFSFRIAAFQAPKTGKRGFPSSHQTRFRPQALFPKWPECDEKIKSGEDESSSRD